MTPRVHPITGPDPVPEDDLTASEARSLPVSPVARSTLRSPEAQREVIDDRPDGQHVICIQPTTSERSEPESLLRRLVKFAKGDDVLSEIRSYAAYDQHVRKGARRLEHRSHPGDDERDEPLLPKKGARIDCTLPSDICSPRGTMALSRTSSPRGAPILSRTTSQIEQTTAIRNMESFLKQTIDPHYAPQYDLSGLVYVFRLLFMGTMPWANRVLQGHTPHQRVLKFLVNCLRGIGQVYFMNNPITGLLILIALFVQNYRTATYGLIALVSSNLFAYALHFGHEMIDSGLFGYNAVLLGVVLATIYDPTLPPDGAWNVPLIFITIFFAIISAVVFLALGRLLAPYKIPPFSVPFNVVLLICVLATHNMQRLRVGPVALPALPQYPTDARIDETAIRTPTAREFFEAIPKGVGQPFAADSTASGIVMILGLLICSPTTAFAACVGSLVGNATALLVGNSAAAISLGVYGYNGALSFACLFGMWFCPSPTAFIIAILGAMLSSVLVDFMAGILVPFGLPVASVPFNTVALLFTLIQGATASVMPVPLESMTVPEDHYERAATVRRIFRVFADIMKGNKRSSLLDRYNLHFNRHQRMTLKPAAAAAAAAPVSLSQGAAGAAVASTNHSAARAGLARSSSLSYLFHTEHAMAFDRASELFKALDKNTNDCLELSEFAGMLSGAGVPSIKQNFLLAVFREMRPADADAHLPAGPHHTHTHEHALRLEDWREYLEVLVAVSALKADISTLMDYADLNRSGSLDANELRNVQKSLNLKLVTKDDLTRFVMACGAEHEDDAVGVDEIISVLVLTFLRQLRAEMSQQSPDEREQVDQVLPFLVKNLHPSVGA